MSEVTTAAENATTEVSTTEPVVQENQVTESSTTEQVTPEVSEPDYSYVPPKFMKDGKPDFETMAKSYQNLEKKASQKGLMVPDDVAEYEWTGTAPTTINDEALNAFKTEAQTAKLSKEQYAFVMDKYAQAITDLGLNAEASAQALEKVWGKDYQTNINSASKAFMEFAPSDINMEEPVFNHPSVVRLLAAIGNELNEDSQSVKGQSSRASGMTKDQINEIRNSPDYWHSVEKQQLVTQWYESNYK